MSQEQTGIVFNIQHYSIHDGPGIRTTVFLNGCPLRCQWCQNPESQTIQPQLFYYREKCTGCGECVQACPQGAITMAGKLSITNRDLCKGHGNCTQVCRNEARNLMGKQVTVQEVFAEVAGDAIFYESSGGGVTLSGGDPTFQGKFTASVLSLCKEASFHTAIETCGFTSWANLQEILEYTDLVLYDIKHMDSWEHEKGTGVANELILNNAKRIYHEAGKPMWVRIPIIPGFNDSKSNVEATAKFVAREMGRDVKVHLLPYHRMGETKYARLEKSDRSILIQPPTVQKMEQLLSIVESLGLEGQIGG